MVEDHWVRVRVGVGGMNKSFQCSGPVPGQAAKASEKKKGRAPKKRDAFPFAARTRTGVQERSALREGESRIWDKDNKIGWAGASDVAAYVLARDSQQAQGVGWRAAAGLG